MDEEAEGIMADTLIAGTTLVEKESRSIGDAPIGSIVAWAKSLSGIPNLAEGWVECDGSVLVDALSPLNGQTIPDLNGTDLFLRGNNTSGGTGGATTTPHTHTITNDDAQTGPDPLGNFGVTDSASPSIIPPFYSVVWIMRIR